MGCSENTSIVTQYTSNLSNLSNLSKITIETSTFNEIRKYYDEILNTDKSTYKSSNDEPTPIDCISEMISKIPDDITDCP